MGSNESKQLVAKMVGDESPTYRAEINTVLDEHEDGPNAGDNAAGPQKRIA